MATSAVKTAVELCAQDQGAVANCTSATNGVPADLGAFGKYGASLTTLAGVITATAVATNGLNGETYILTPTYSPTTGVSWVVTGTCVAANICKQ